MLPNSLRCRAVPLARMAQRSVSTFHQPASSGFDLKLNKLEFEEQTVYAGTNSLLPLVESLRGKRPLVVSDQGVASAGILDEAAAAMRDYGVEPSLFTECKPNPSYKDVAAIANAFVANECEVIVGIGGGGPLDAAKAAVAAVAHQRVTPQFDFANDTKAFIAQCRKFGTIATPAFQKATPHLFAVATTAGTGSDGGKSAVIKDESGAKVVFGHPVLMPKVAALVPQFTAKLPQKLTVATGVDALFHCLEPLFCPTKIMIERDGMTQAQIDRCDAFALSGMALVTANLPALLETPDCLQSRLHMLIAALYGAKAFRKGDLGGVHATAHAVGAKFDLHHGECVGRMAVPVLEHNENDLRLSNEAVQASAKVAAVFGGADSMTEAVRSFLRSVEAPLGIADIVSFSDELDDLAELAAADGCQTNPVPMSVEDYRAVFERAVNM